MGEIKECVICGNPLPPHKSKYCCAECKAEGDRRSWREYYLRTKDRQNALKKLRRKQKGKAPKVDNIVEYKDGMTYAERQKKETIEMFARVEL